MNEILQKRIEEAAENLINYNLVDLSDLVNQYDLRRLLIEMGVKILQNQWISVEEALPTERDEEDEQYSTNVFTRTKDCIRYAYYDFYNESWCSVEGGYRFGGDVTHWMPIPSLEGGE